MPVYFYCFGPKTFFLRIFVFLYLHFLKHCNFLAQCGGEIINELRCFALENYDDNYQEIYAQSMSIFFQSLTKV